MPHNLQNNRFLKQTHPSGALIKSICIFLLLFFHFSISFCQQPTLEWVRRYSPSSNYSANGLSIKQDSSGYVYVLVAQATDTTYGDYGVLKYSPGGSLIWSASYNSPSNLDETPKAFDVSKAGEIYVTGSSGINFEYHILTVKFNSSGILQWAKEYNGGYGDGANDLKIDKNGDIIICGGSSVNNNISYALAVKYNSNGDSLWVRKFTQFQYSYTRNLVLDDSSNVYIAGVHRVSMNQSNYLTLKYYQNGNLAWFSSYGVTDFAASANSIAIDLYRNVYVVGTLDVPQPGTNNVLVKINQAGIQEWARAYTGISNNNSCGNTPTGLSIVSDGSRIYYTTVCGSTGNTPEFVTLGYNSFGDTLWVRRFPIGGSGIPQYNPSSLKLDRNGSVYIAGSSVNLDAGVILKYSSSGIQQWMVVTDSSSPNSIYIDTSFNIYSVGWGGFNNITNAVAIKYSQIIGILPNNNEVPILFKLFQNFPNPFNPVSYIEFHISKLSNVNITVFDVLGRVADIPVNEQLNPGIYEISIDGTKFSSGTYFYRMTADGIIVDTKKLVLVK